MQRQCTTHKLLASAERAAGTVNSGWFKVGSAIEGTLIVSVTAENGSATLDIDVQCSPDGDAATPIVAIHTSLSQITAVGTALSKLTQIGEWIRVSCVVGGSATPKFTYSVYLTIKT